VEPDLDNRKEEPLGKIRGEEKERDTVNITTQRCGDKSLKKNAKGKGKGLKLRPGEVSD